HPTHGVQGFTMCLLKLYWRASAMLGAATLTFLALTGSSAMAQVFPDRPIRFVIGFGIGGPTDIVAHTPADPLSQNTGIKAILDAKAGASGNIATEAVATAAPDGYTYLIA